MITLWYQRIVLPSIYLQSNQIIVYALCNVYISAVDILYIVL